MNITSIGHHYNYADGISVYEDSLFMQMSIKMKFILIPSPRQSKQTISMNYACHGYSWMYVLHKTELVKRYWHGKGWHTLIRQTTPSLLSKDFIWKTEKCLSISYSPFSLPLIIGKTFCVFKPTSAFAIPSNHICSWWPPPISLILCHG